MSAITATLGKYIGSRYQESSKWRYQCVARVKLAAFLVHKKYINSFGGSAKNGWSNAFNTFPKSEWTKVVNNPKDPNQVPSEGDIIFFDTVPVTVEGVKVDYDHVAIVSMARKGSNMLMCIEQNGGRGSGTGLGTDAIREVEKDYVKDKVLGRYTPRKFIKGNISV